MTYRPVELSALIEVTINLKNDFRVFSNRYSPPEFDVLCKGILGAAAVKGSATGKAVPEVPSLEAAYRKQVADMSTFWYRKSVTSTRLAQISCITLTANEITQSKQTDADWLEHNRQVLLGAIIYRHYRLEEQARAVPGMTTFWGKADECSALEVCLKRLLNIHEENKLDLQTVVSCCIAYRDYLCQGNVKDGYAYILDNPKTYLPDLNNLIEEKQKEIEATVSIPIQFIEFIQSLVPLISSYDEQLSTLLPLLLEPLKVRVATDELKKEDILACIKPLITNPSCYKLVEKMIPAETLLMSLDEVEDFINTMKQIKDYHCQFALLGAYVMSLEACAQTFSTLARTLNHAIVNNAENILDIRSRARSLRALDRIVKSTDVLSVDTAAWGGSEGFKKALLLRLNGLEARLLPPATEKAAARP